MFSPSRPVNSPHVPSDGLKPVSESRNPAEPAGSDAELGRLRDKITRLDQWGIAERTKKYGFQT